MAESAEAAESAGNSLCQSGQSRQGRKIPSHPATGDRLGHQAAEVSSAACHITQTTPPHDASDTASRTQRAMTTLPCVFR